MIRRPFNVASVLSLLLLVGIVILWVRSYSVADELAFVHSKKLSFTCRTGVLWVESCDCFYSGPYDPQTQEYGADGPYAERIRVILRHHNPSPPTGGEECEGSDWVGLEGSNTITHETRTARAGIPLWLLAGNAAVLPLIATRRLLSTVITRRRLAARVCPACRYDLRASTGRCPECGTPIPAEAST